ncbi:MAG: hypothetical protein JNJ48_04050 [Phycisphaerae bacterium]|nr:hypothetical protein [Phycisphaerae bacterium]
MNDRRLMQLLEDARLAAELERPFAAAGARDARARVLWAGLGAACAAAAVVLATLWLWPAAPGRGLVPGPSVATTNAQGQPRTNAPVGAQATDAGREWVLLAIAEDAFGEVRCVRWSPIAWGGRHLGEVSPEELKLAGVAMNCDPAAERIIVVGLEGARGELPATDDQASAIASCLMRAAPCGPGAFDPDRCALSGGGCVGPTLAVRVERVLASR